MRGRSKDGNRAVGRLLKGGVISFVVLVKRGVGRSFVHPTTPPPPFLWFWGSSRRELIDENRIEQMGENRNWCRILSHCNTWEQL